MSGTDPVPHIGASDVAFPGLLRGLGLLEGLITPDTLDSGVGRRPDRRPGDAPADDTLS